MNELNKKLADIQQRLKAPKGQFNKFANFNYRSCEDILEAVKPLLGDLVLTITDEIHNIGDRYYVVAYACLLDGENEIGTKAFAREADTKAGMDVAQITGAASSYARKYALNGLFLIDDTKDADNDDNTVEDVKPIIKQVDKPRTMTYKAPKSITATTSNGTAVICGCGREITPAIEKYSVQKYGEPLCMVCQSKRNRPTKNPLLDDLDLSVEGIK